jgi:branched-chain amino acid transport system ATP-binding protein
VTAALLEVRDLSVTFGGLRAVDGVSFTVAESQVYGVIGPNGAGKTTLLNGVSGFLPLASGTVSLRGARLDRLAPHAVAQRGVSRTFQAVEVFNDFTVRDYLLVSRLRRQRRSLFACAVVTPAVRASERAERQLALDTLEEFELGHLAGEPLHAIGYGQRKVVDILRALIADPVILLLDEPTSGTSSADRLALRRVLGEAKARQVAAVVVDHDVSFISDTCDHVLAMNLGAKLAEGLPNEVLTNKDVVSAYLGARAEPGGSGSRPRFVREDSQT